MAVKLLPPAWPGSTAGLFFATRAIATRFNRVYFER